MGDYTAPPAAATCESVDADVSADASADVPVAYDRELDADVCLDVDLGDARDGAGPSVDLDASADVRKDSTST